MPEVSHVYCGSSLVKYQFERTSVPKIVTELLQTTFAMRGSLLLCFGEFICAFCFLGSYALHTDP